MGRQNIWAVASYKQCTETTYLSLKMAVFWVVAPCSLVEVYRLIALMMKAASTSEMSVNIYQTTRHNTSEESHLHTHCCENLKSNFLSLLIDCGHA
jgi:hypothetical protein